MGASFPPILLPPGAFAYKDNLRVPITNIHLMGPCIPNTSLGSDSTNNSFNSRAVNVVPTLVGGLSDIVLKFPQFNQVGNAPELPIPSAFTVSASIEYPIGSTPLPFFFQGQLTGTVNPGSGYLATDPFPVFIPAGSSFAIKIYGTWTGTFIFGGRLASSRPTVDWTTAGVNVPNHTLDNTVLVSSTPGMGYTPIVYGIPLVKMPVVGIVGDSIGGGQADALDFITFGTSWGRALKNRISLLNLSIGASRMTTWLQRWNGTWQLYKGCTHIVFELGVNDLDGGQTLNQMTANATLMVMAFISQGIKVYPTTLMPRTSSTDGFISVSGQTITSFEAIRVGYNNWWRNNWASLGCAGLIDNDFTIDPTASGKWSFDAGATPLSVSTQQGFYNPVMTNGVITNLTCTTQGGGYPATSGTLNWTAVPYLGETGSGGSGTVSLNGTGGLSLSSFTINDGGSNFSYPPMINIQGPFTFEGLHPSVRAWNQLFSKGTFTPSLFNL
jgi:hypothetical protein